MWSGSNTRAVATMTAANCLTAKNAVSRHHQDRHRWLRTPIECMHSYRECPRNIPLRVPPKCMRTVLEIKCINKNVKEHTLRLSMKSGQNIEAKISKNVQKTQSNNRGKMVQNDPQTQPITKGNDPKKTM